MTANDHNQEACRRARELLPAFAAGRMTDAEGEALAEHLARCPECAGLFELDPELKARLLAGVARPAAPPDFGDRVRQSLGKAGPSRSAARWIKGLAAAAALFIVLNLGSLFKSGILPHEFVMAELRIRASLEKIHALLGVGLGDHLICTVYRRLAEEPPGPEQVVDDMGEQWAPLAAITAERAPDGFEVRLAHRCRYGGRDFLHLAMHDGDRLLSLIITQRLTGDSFDESGLTAARRLGGLDVYEGSVDEFGVSSLETDDYLVYLVSDLTAAEQAAAAARLLPSTASFLAAATRAGLPD